MSKNKVSYEKKVEIVRDYLDGRVGYKESIQRANNSAASAFPENIQQRRKCEAGCNGRVQVLTDKIADGGLAASLCVPFRIVLTAALRLNDRKAIFAADLIGNAANIFKVIFERIAIFHSIHE